MSNMFKRGDPVRLKIFRGVVMNMLYMATQGDAVNPDDPDVLSREVLKVALESVMSLPNEQELNNAVRYLEQREYVAASWRRDGSGEFSDVRLRAKGVDLVERTTQDPGVTFSQRR